MEWFKGRERTLGEGTHEPDMGERVSGRDVHSVADNQEHLNAL